jgi:KaiC/GvpD/RAD55 family RecA-like ATPase
MRRLGYDLERLETENRIQIIDVKSLKGTGLSLNVQLIIETVAKNNARRLVIDSLSALLAACQERFDNRTLMHLFYRILKNHCCTTIMTCSIPTCQKTVGWGIEEFIAGALLILGNGQENAEQKRRLLI